MAVTLQSSHQLKHPTPSTRLYAGWIGSVIAANIVAVTAASLIRAETAPAVLFVALLEGACLGFLQQALIRKLRPGLENRWFSATLIGVLVARGVQFGCETGPVLSLSYRWPIVAQYAGAATAGLLVGVIMATPQFLALRGRVERPGMWLAARGVGAAVAFTWLFAAQRALGAIDTGLFALFVLLLAVFSVAGAAAGTIEAIVLHRLLPQASAETT